MTKLVETHPKYRPTNYEEILASSFGELSQCQVVVDVEDVKNSKKPNKLRKSRTKSWDHLGNKLRSRSTCHGHLPCDFKTTGQACLENIFQGFPLKFIKNQKMIAEPPTEKVW